MLVLEETSLTMAFYKNYQSRIEVQAVTTLKVAHDSSRACPFLLLDQEDKEASADRGLSDFALGPLYT